MFGQQPQQQYGYPQQGYGYQQPQRQPAQLSSLGDLLAGNSAKAYFDANSQPGDAVTGVIEKIETTQVNDFQTKQPAFGTTDIRRSRSTSSSKPSCATRA